MKGKVIIGNGGAELGVRGYVSAYDADDRRARLALLHGAGRSRRSPSSRPALERAAKTWTGEWWKIGGGGTVWDSIAYDPTLDLLYVGTGNGSPWSRQARSPGGGDNLYVCLDPRAAPRHRRAASGTTRRRPATPGTSPSTQHMILADLAIGGAPRKVLMQAPKNGFFYVLDRATGELISAEKFAEVTWATGVDLASGPADRDRDRALPGRRPDRGEAVAPRRPQLAADVVQSEDRARLHPRAGDPVLLQARPEVPLPARRLEPRHRLERRRALPARARLGPPARLGSGGAEGGLARASTRARGTAARSRPPATSCSRAPPTARFVAYRATDGKLLFEAPAGTGIVAAPITYRVDGEQYVTVMAGWGGAFALAGGDAAAAAGVHDNRGPHPDLQARRHGEAARCRSRGARDRRDPGRARSRAREAGPRARSRAGAAVCHGAGAESGGVLPDLRKSEPELLEPANLHAIVREGAFLRARHAELRRVPLRRRTSRRSASTCSRGARRCWRKRPTRHPPPLFGRKTRRRVKPFTVAPRRTP